jgi:DNA modification methylase
MPQKIKLTWYTVRRRVDDLIPFKGNPRKLDVQQETALIKSLKRFDLAEIPVCDLDNTILAGHARLRIMQILGRGQEEIDIRIPSRKLSDEERKAYLLTSNAVRGSWDYDLLREFDTELILDIGFNHEELQHLWEADLEVEDGELDEQKEIEQAQSTNIQPGDYFALGRHRLLCTDALNPESAKKLMGGIQANMINDDIPFNIGLRYDQNFTGRKRYGGTTNDKKSDDDYRTFVKSIMQNALSVIKPDAHILFWCDERYVWLLQQLYRELGINSKRLCIWIKGNQSPTPQVAFNKVTEFVVYGTIGTPYLNDKIQNLNEIINKQIETGNRLMDDVLDLLNIWLVNRLPGNEYEHPTMKPPTLYEKALRRCTRPGDVILDLTAGSGSLLVAAEQLKRTAYLCELEPVFCQVIINRFKKISNEKVIKLN